MKKYIIIAALSVGCTLSAMDNNHITTMISTPTPHILLDVFHKQNFIGQPATELSKCIGNRTIREYFVYKHITKAVFNHYAQNTIYNHRDIDLQEGTRQHLFKQINNLMTSIKRVSIIHDKKDNSIDNIINGRPAKL